MTSKYDKIPILTSSDVNLRLSTGKFILKTTRITLKIAKKHEINRTIVIFRWKMEIYFISWTLDGHIFTSGKPLVKICRLMLTRWNKFGSSTENNNYPINNQHMREWVFSANTVADASLIQPGTAYPANGSLSGNCFWLTWNASCIKLNHSASDTEANKMFVDHCQCGAYCDLLSF